ncbi:MAG: thioesterase family protein [Polyangiales bacterium]
MRDEALPTRDGYAHFDRIETRWADNDVYGHVNNVVYYAYFDTVINRVLTAAGLDPATSPVIGLCVESGCRYVAPATYPETLDAGLRVAKLGRSSVRYELGIFRDETLCAFGHFVHVFVDRASRRPAPLPEAIRAALEPMLRQG